MSDAEAEAVDGSDAEPEESPVSAAMDDAVGNTVLPRYLLVGVVIALGWWRLVGGLSTYVAALGAVGLVMALPSLVGVLASRRWPTVEAVVTESMVLTKDQALSLGGRGGTPTGSGGGYVPLVRYEYEVDGERYESARVSPVAGTISRRRWAAAVVDAYPRGKHVTARYDPGDPSHAYLRSWVRSSPFFVSVLVAAGFFGAAAWFAADTPDGAPVVAFAVGLSVFLFGLRQLRRSLASRRWPTTPGEVTARSIEVKGGSGESTSGPAYVPKFRYEYEVDGDRYVSARYSFGGWSGFSSQEAAEEWLEDYPEGSEVTVHYSTDRPDMTVLEPGGSGALFALLFGLLWIGLGVFLVLRPDLWTSAMPS